MAISRLLPASFEQPNRTNFIHNGEFNVSQRFTSKSIIEGYTLDRWKIDRANVDNWAATVSQDSNVPAACGFQNSLKVQTTTAESALAADEYGIIEHIIEAQNLQHLNWGASNSGGKKITLSFWVKSNVTGTYCNSLYHYDGNDMVNSTYTINSADTWEFKSVTYDANALTDGEIDDNNEAGIKINWILFSGADQKGTSASTWASYTQSMFAHGHNVNIGASTSNYWQITGVCLNEGSKSLSGNDGKSFPHEPFSESLKKCQRYYFRMEGADIDGGKYSTHYQKRSASGYFYTDTAVLAHFYFPVPMRAAPTALEQSGTDNHYDFVYRNTTSTPSGSVIQFNDATQYYCTTYQASHTDNNAQGEAGQQRISNASGYLAWSTDL